MRSVFYTKAHIKIVESGADAVAEVLRGTDTDEKASLLLCLDKYLDPWYGYNLPFRDTVFRILQEMVLEPNPREIKQDALQLLIEYGRPPHEILEAHPDAGFSCVEPALLPEVRYLLTGLWLEKPSASHGKEAEDFRREYAAAGQTAACGALRDPDQLLQHRESGGGDPAGPPGAFFAVREIDDRIVGALDILPEQSGGVLIRCDIRPSERSCAEAVLRHALDRCRMLGARRASLCCHAGDAEFVRAVTGCSGALEACADSPDGRMQLCRVDLL